jgi:hypothetical protein
MRIIEKLQWLLSSCYSTAKSNKVVIFNLWLVWFYQIFPHYLTNGKIFGKKVIEHKMCVLISFTNPIWKISHSTKNPATFYNNCTKVFTYSPRYSCQILTKLGFYRLYFEKMFIYQISWKSVKSKPRFFIRTEGQRNWQRDMTKLIVAVRSFANEDKYNRRCMETDLQKGSHVYGPSMTSCTKIKVSLLCPSV